jgi:hypothetical protein
LIQRNSEWIHMGMWCTGTPTPHHHWHGTLITGSLNLVSFCHCECPEAFAFSNKLFLFKKIDFFLNTVCFFPLRYTIPACFSLYQPSTYDQVFNEDFNGGNPEGGKTMLPNLRIVQWQAYLRKRNRLEFLVPWWDLQHGCSINQFLSAFAAKNADFRYSFISTNSRSIFHCVDLYIISC